EDLASSRPVDDPVTLIALADGPGLLLSLALSDGFAVRSDREDLVEAVSFAADLAEAAVFVLPDSATAAEALTGRVQAKVLRTRDAASVAAAAAVFDPAGQADDLLEDMIAAAAGTRVGAVLCAAEDHGQGPLLYSAGDALTVVDGRIRAVSADPEAAAQDLVSRLLGAGGDLVTLL